MEARSAETSSAQRSGVGQGVLTGLAPVALFAVIGALAVAATILVRSLTDSQAFLTQLPELLITLGIGLLLAFVAWIIGFVWALRRERAWEQAGASARAAATLWALGVSAFILILPVILAILLPQHPAHPAP